MRKTCSKCGVGKSVSEFYEHRKMPDGYLAQCKECVKKRVRERERRLRSDPEWVERERERARSKYHRLGYLEKSRGKKAKVQNSHRIKYPEKYKATVASQRISKPKGYHVHHWSYLESHRKDVMIMKPGQHAKAHRFLVYDPDEFLYRDKKGNLLKSKEDHYRYLILNGVRIHDINPF